MRRRKKSSLRIKLVIATITWLIVFGLIIYFIPSLIVQIIIGILGLSILAYNLMALIVMHDNTSYRDFSDKDFEDLLDDGHLGI